ncbi:MAG: GNAT family N-acetyltransferase [Asticcacaulis sp.]
MISSPNHYEPLAFLGPIVVDPVYRGQGIGRSLIRTAVDAAFAKGLRAVLLVGRKAISRRSASTRPRISPCRDRSIPTAC